MNTKKADKKPYVITSVGVVIASILILGGVMRVNKDEIKTETPKVVIEMKKKLTEKEQFALKPVADLVSSVVNRFEDEISKNRAEQTSKLLIKEFIKEQGQNKEIDNWGVFIENVTKSQLKKWNNEHEEKFAKELKKLSEDKEIQNIPVEEIAQTSPLYILQEKKIIQRELFEQWNLLAKDDVLEILDNPVVKIEEEIKPITPPEVDPILKPESENVLLKPNEDTLLIKPIEANSKEKEVSTISIQETTLNKEKKKETEKSDELKQLQDDLEKAKQLAKELDIKKMQINEELEKNSKSLKEIEDEIVKTKSELKKLEKELK